MSTLALLSIAAGGIALLLLLIIRWEIHAFIALMLVSLLVALATGMPIGDIISTMVAGMGGTLGSVAILVALGAMLNVANNQEPLCRNVDTIAVDAPGAGSCGSMHIALGPEVARRLVLPWLSFAYGWSF